MVRIRVSLHGMYVCQCNVLKSNRNKRVCVGTFVSEQEHLVSLRQSWSSFTPFCGPSRVDYSTMSVLSFFYFCPKFFYRPFSSSFLPTFTLTLLLSNSASYIFPLSPHHPPTRVPFSLSLLSWWASQEAVPAFEERNLLFLPFPFPFQSSVHSWNHGALHADEQELTFSRTYIQTRDGQEKGRKKEEEGEEGEREGSSGGRRMKDYVMKQSNSCWEREIVQFNFIVIQAYTSA